MSSQQSTGKEISMAIRGYGALAAVAIILLLYLLLDFGYLSSSICVHVISFFGV